ncbi:MAG: AraC family transcriptional regulator [Ruminococcaceae bacterium]|nr:AraC family transcriptional regulator [Oscillospiraceae bacterium]
MASIDINVINPYIRVAMRSVITKGYRIKQRIIFDYELIYIESGGMTFYYDGTPYECRKGQFILIRPGIPHAFDCSRHEVSQPHIHFDPIFAPDSTSVPVSFKDAPEMTPTEHKLIRRDLFYSYPRKPFVFFDNTDNALALFYRVIEAFSSGKRLMAKGVFIELLCDLIHDNFPDALSASNGTELDIATQLKDLIDATHGVTISLEALQKQFSYSKFYLERRFKSRYKISLISYANQKRMEYSKNLLKNMTVSEAAEKVGFSSIYSFSRAYKCHFGHAPSQSNQK